jgi:hypothetical protein
VLLLVVADRHFVVCSRMSAAITQGRRNRPTLAASLQLRGRVLNCVIRCTAPSSPRS